jgi:hypothetical protein
VRKVGENIRRKNKHEQKDRIKDKDADMSIYDQKVEDQLLVGTRRPASLMPTSCTAKAHV